MSPGRFSEANNCDKFIKVTLVEICVYWKYLKCLHVHENRYQGENNSHVNKSAFGIDFLWRYGIIKVCFTCLLAVWGNVPLNLSFFVTSVNNTNPLIIIFMFCPTEYSISWYWPQWLVQEGIQTQPISSYPGIVTKVTQKLDTILLKVTACLQNQTDKELFQISLLPHTHKKNLCTYCCRW